mgnify:CR=1 FL=1
MTEAAQELAKRFLARSNLPPKASEDAAHIAIATVHGMGTSPINDLENAWGQFFMYARVLQRRDPNRHLYLAVSRNTFETLFKEEAGQLLLEEPGFRMIVFDSKTEEIIQWQLQINS